MTTKFAPRRYFWIVLVILLVACGNLAPQAMPTATQAPIPTVTTAPSLTPVSPTPTMPPATPTQTSALPVSSPPDGLRMAYILDGNLYFQEGSNLPLQLTSSGEDVAPQFSDDGQKIAFFRGGNPSGIYSINADGSAEQAVVTSSQLVALNLGYGETTAPFDTAFVPGTHLLLFRTIRSREGTSFTSNSDLLVVDTDTAEIRRILPPEQVGAFYISPDGRLIAIDAIGRIDVIDIRGKIIRQNLLTYTPSEPVFLPPGISWTSDSTGLVVILPVPTFYETSAGGPDYTVWRYALDGSTKVQVLLDPLPKELHLAKVSPDGNWIIYNNYDQYAFYIGNLQTGHAELLEPQSSVSHYYWSWSPDSKHFVYSVPPRDTIYLGLIGGSPEFISNAKFLGWIDSKRYLYCTDKNIVLGDTTGSKEVILAAHDSFKDKAIFTFILPQPQ